jgi:hypothetical protein
MAGSNRSAINGWINRTGERPLGAMQSVFPSGATAVIYRPSRSVTTSGKGNTRCWKLCFERRIAPVIEPMMGWTGGEDTLPQLELRFPSAESAIAYARRQGIDFVVRGRNSSAPVPCTSASSSSPNHSLHTCSPGEVSTLIA